MFTQPFIWTQIKENIKASRHWPLCGEFTGTGEFPAQRASYAENVSIWWRHHGLIKQPNPSSSSIVCNKGECLLLFPPIRALFHWIWIDCWGQNKHTNLQWISQIHCKYVWLWYNFTVFKHVRQYPWPEVARYELSVSWWLALWNDNSRRLTRWQNNMWSTGNC